MESICAHMVNGFHKTGNCYAFAWNRTDFVGNWKFSNPKTHTKPVVDVRGP